jgi:hypothetical protein
MLFAHRLRGAEAKSMFDNVFAYQHAKLTKTGKAA